MHDDARDTARIPRPTGSSRRPTVSATLLVGTCAVWITLVPGGCPAPEVQTGDGNVAQVSSAFEIPSVLSARIRVQLVNRLPQSVVADLTMRLAGQTVHEAERAIPAGESRLLAGPDAADSVTVRALRRLPSGDAALPDQAFRMGEGFREGDTIVIVLEESPPPILICPADAVVDCAGSIDPSVTRFAQAGGSPEDPPTVTFEDLEISAACPRVLLRRWTARDSLGRTNVCEQRITVEDRTPPILTCVPDVTIACDQPIDPSARGSASAIDDCDPSPKVTFTDKLTGDCPAEIVRTWRAEDACGNFAECTQVIRLESGDDGEAPFPVPSISCPPDIELPCGATAEPDGIPPVPCEGGARAILDEDEAAPLFTELEFGVVAQTIGVHSQSGDGRVSLLLSLAPVDPSGVSGGTTTTLISGVPTHFSLVFDAESRVLTLRLAGVALRRDIPVGDPADELFVDLFAARDCAAQLAQLSWNGAPLDQEVTASDSAGRERGLRVACGDASEGFTLSGTVTLSIPPPEFTGPDAPRVGFGVSARRIVYDSRGVGRPQISLGGDPQIRLDFVDVQIGDECDGEIRRTWTATDSYGQTATCVQIIRFVPN